MPRTWRAAPPNSASRIGGPVSVDMKRVKARKDQISGKSQYRRRNLAEEHGQLHGLSKATRVSNRRTRSASATHGSRADRIFINVGGRAVVPAFRGWTIVPYLTNSSMMEIDFLPRHLIIVGGSYIGLEFGQMFRRFGSEVTILEMGPRLIQREDQDVSDAIREILRTGRHRHPLERESASRLQSTATRSSSASECARQAEESADRIFCSRSEGVPTPTISVWTKPASKPIRTATSRWTISCAPTFPVSGRWAIATARAGSRILRITILKSSPQICSTTIRAASATAF